MKKIALVASLVIIALCASAGAGRHVPAIYYVDATTGDDGDSGLTEALAWKTVAKVNASAFNAGDSILFKRGEEWREKLVVPSSGTAGNVITFGAYGTGNRPVFNASEIVANGDFEVYVGSPDPTEMLGDGGFDGWVEDSTTNMTYWTEYISGTSTVNQESSDLRPGTTGLYSVRFDVDASNSNMYVNRSVVLPLSQPATLSVWYKTEAGKTAYLQLFYSSGNIGLKSDGTWSTAGTTITLPEATSWTQYSLNFTTHATATTFTMRVGRLSAASSSLYFDDLSITSLLVYTNVYRALWDNPLSSVNYQMQMWEDGVRLTQPTPSTTIYGVDQTPGLFNYPGDGYLYVHGLSSDNIVTNGKVYEIGNLSENIDDNKKDYLLFTGLEWKKCAPPIADLGGLLLTGSYNTVSDCVGHDMRRHAANFYHGSVGCVIEDCEFYDITFTSTVVFFGTATDNILRDCDLYDAFRTVVAVHGGATNSTITGNHFWNRSSKATNRMIYSYGCDGLVISYNKFDGYGTNMIDATYDAPENTNLGVKIYGNIIDATHLSDNIFDLVKAPSAEIYNNTIYGNAEYALYQAAASTGVLFKNNIVYGTKYVSVDDGAQVDSEYDYNCYYSATGTPFNWTGTDYNFADWKTNSSQDAHSISVDPQFYSASDYRLRITSPCRRAGVSVGMTTDYLGNSVPAWTGKAPDIGAYEMRMSGIVIR